MRVPASTYRLQITEDFDLLEAAKRLTYLNDLGVDWVYLSPVLSAASGSSHGYDVADHSSIDPSRGRGAGLSALAMEAQRLGMGVLVDIVPNHVGISRPWENDWWWSVLTHGPESPYASAFDIDWDAGNGRVRIPVVGDDDLGSDGRIDNLQVLGGQLHYHDQRFPLGPGTAEGGPAEDPNAVHARQRYQLVSWREGDSTLNYRRFFTVNSLAAIRVEDPVWFDRTHEEILRWFDEGLVDGLRIDHPDGLRDPVGYLARLAEKTSGAYVLIEKILEPGEALPTGMATSGTTGYDVLAQIDRVLTDPAGERPLTELDTRLRGEELDWHELIHDSKRYVADHALLSETRRIVRELLRHPRLADADDAPEFETAQDAVAELLACFGVYRSYLPDFPDTVAYLDDAAASAQAHRPDLRGVIERVLPVLTDGTTEACRRFQQTSGMVMAKGVEDCAFYRYGRLTSLNEVGGDPSVFAVSVPEFHAAMTERQELWPAAMSAGTTHDTKRGEDVRARIAVLAELPDIWADAVDRLQELAPMPDAAFANLVWQAVVGCWSADPALRERLHGYVEKAMREAGDHTTWTKVDEDYEHAVHAAVDAAFDDADVRALLTEVVDTVADHGWSNALAAKLLTLTVPGVPDVYQGSERWEQSLVDPDNRRPVDYAERREMLDSDQPAQEGGVGDDGSRKLGVVTAALRLRREQPELFDGYAELTSQGPAADHLVAFDRGGAITLATRLPAGLAERGGWGDTRVALRPGRWRDVLTGTVHELAPPTDESGAVSADGAAEVLVADLLAGLPVALLVALPEPARDRTRFDVWAPLPERITLVIGERHIPMAKHHDDWWSPTEPVPSGHVDYGFLVDDNPSVLPDPRSRWQPHGVHGPTRTFDPDDHDWGDQGWTGRQLAGGVIYELHIGTFTPEGTLDAAIERLDHLVDIGVDFVELMPVNAVNGTHNWGYDGVLWHSVHHEYGGPAAYQRFVDAAHARGLGVIQDVVHNHFGPSGNYLPVFGPYLKPGENPWGDLVNLDGDGAEEVRRYILDGIRRFFVDFHVDGLRLDAVHALHDESETHLLEEMAVETAALSAHLRRPLTLIAESDLNDPRLVTPREAGGHGLDAQWSDDFHHALHVALTGETGGYYADFAPLGSLAKVLERGFFHDGTWSSFRGRDHGVPIDRERMPAWRLVVCSQNHDQIGNRARGDRLTEHLDDDQLASAALLTLAGPFTPMLFQGEEWAATAPFQFFTSHPEPDLARAVTEGRLAEFAEMDWDASVVPNPQDPDTFARSKLDWSEPEHGRHAVILQVYRELAALRRELPDLTDPDLRQVSVDVDEDARWLIVRRGRLTVAVNFGDDPAELDLGHPAHRMRWTTPAGAELEAGVLRLPAHGGCLVVPG